MQKPKTTCKNTHIYTHKVRFICVHINAQDTDTTVLSSNTLRSIRAPNQQQYNKKKNIKKTKLCFLCLALLLTGDNNLRTASPCCLAPGVSACLCVCPNARSVPQLITGNTTHGPSYSRLSLTSAHTQSDCLSEVSGQPKQARELSQPRLTVTSSNLVIYSALYLIRGLFIYLLTQLAIV